MDLIFSSMAATCFALGGVAMKLSEGLTRPGPSASVYALFAAGATFQALAMRQAPLGASYLLVLGLESGLAFGMGVLCFREPASPTKLLALGLIAAGIALLHREDPGPAPMPPSALPHRSIQPSSQPHPTPEPRP